MSPRACAKPTLELRLRIPKRPDDLSVRDSRTAKKVDILFRPVRLSSQRDEMTTNPTAN